ncbi:MAG: hybrid sensor histidine kinase/response regulator [Thermodesulfobacteriota bacterium]
MAPKQDSEDARLKRLEQTLAVCLEEKQAAEQKSDYYQELFDKAPFAYQSLDTNGLFLEVNRTWLDMLGYAKKEEVVGKPFTALVHPKWLDRVKENFPRYKQQGAISGVEYKLIRKDGMFVDVSASGRISYHDNGAVKQTHCLLQDVTDTKRAEGEQKKIEEQMRHVQKLESLGVLAGGIAHDFNNLLMVILGNADLALSELSPVSPARENILAIEKAARRSAELCKQMLAYAGKGRFVVQPINLSEIVEAMTHMLEVSVSKKNVLKYNFTPNLPMVEADISQIRQVIMNLVINAAEAIGDRSGVVSISTGAMECDTAYLANTFVYEQHLPEGIYCYVEVADTGCGMDNEIKARLFDPFFTTKFTGRGLGMSAVLGIARSHRGAIKVYTEPGRGTTVKVLFPALQANGKQPSHAVPQVVEPGFAGKTLLLVDDEETVRAVGRQMLERMGFSVIPAKDGREAVAIYRAQHENIDCVVMDLTMPHMDGEEAFREMRRINAEVQVVLSSGYHEEEVTQRFTGKGLAGFIQKPYTMSPLREVLKTLFTKQ